MKKGCVFMRTKTLMKVRKRPVTWCGVSDGSRGMSSGKVVSQLRFLSLAAIPAEHLKTAPIKTDYSLRADSRPTTTEIRPSFVFTGGRFSFSGSGEAADRYSGPKMESMRPRRRRRQASSRTQVRVYLTP